MPLLIPGLHEAAAKTLAKRLHKALVQHPGVPSLTQLQTLLAQAAGHTNWHAAQRFWADTATRSRGERPIDSDSVEQARFAFYGAKERFDIYMPQALQHLDDSQDLAVVAMGSLDALRATLIPLGEAAKTVESAVCTLIIERLQDILRKSERPGAFVDPRNAVARMAPLLERFHYEMAVCLYPHRAPPSFTDPRTLLLERVSQRGDWALLEDAMAQACAAPVDDRNSEHEANSAVRDACAWWNRTASSSLQTAECLSVYVFDDTLGALICLSEREAPPALISDFMADDGSSCCAVFEEPGRPLVVLKFFKSREAYREDIGTMFDPYRAVMGLRELDAVLEGT